MKPLKSSAPRHSILCADFDYANSVRTDIRRLFDRIRREQTEIATAQAEQTAREHRVLPLKRRV
jgi:hypothetical protein